MYIYIYIPYIYIWYIRCICVYSYTSYKYYTPYYTHTIHALYYTIGTNPEESAEDVGTVQVPSSWRPIVQDTATLQLFFDYYLTSSPPSSSLALQSLVHLSSIRRSLFPSEKERAVFLQALMTGMCSVLYVVRCTLY